MKTATSSLSRSIVSRVSSHPKLVTTQRNILVVWAEDARKFWIRYYVPHNKPVDIDRRQRRRSGESLKIGVKAQLKLWFQRRNGHELLWHSQ
jgi:hypothetical protein